MSTWYRTGTISVANGSATVTGSGTAFVANVTPGMMVVHDMRIIGEVEAVVSNTQVTLAANYEGTAITAASYAIANLGSVRDGLIAAVQAAIAAFNAAQDGPLSGRFGDGTLAEPGMAFADDLDTGFYRPGVNRIAASKVFEAPAFGGAGVQSSPTDTTPGRLLTPGAFGLGTAITLGASDNLDGVLSSGFYYNPTAGNTPGNNYPISSAGALIVIFRSSTAVVQEYTSFGGDGSAAAVRKFVRSHGLSGWTPWVEVFHQGRIIGTVSQSGGVPTGAIIERGSNANGSYIRYASGTQICRGLASSGGDGLGTVETLPAAFVDANYNVTVTCNANFPRMCVAFSKSASNFRMQTYSEAGGASSSAGEYIAIGDWF